MKSNPKSGHLGTGSALVGRDLLRCAYDSILTAVSRIWVGRQAPLLAGQKTIRGSLHYAPDDDAVRRFGRDDVFFQVREAVRSHRVQIDSTAVELGQRIRRTRWLP